MRRLIKIKKYLIEAFLGFVLWSILLTPYMIFVTKVSLDQYLYWLLMEAIVVPPCSIIVINITNKIEKKLRLN